MVSLIEQLSAFGLTIVGGIMMGVVFDVFRVVRGGAGTRRTFVWALDILYWLLVTPPILGLLWRANHGELRFYVILGVVIGSLLYNTLCSPFVLEALSTLWHVTGRTVGWFVHTVVVVVTWPVLIMRSFVFAWRARRPSGTRRTARNARSGPGRSFFQFLWRPTLAWRRR